MSDIYEIEIWLSANEVNSVQIGNVYQHRTNGRKFEVTRVWLDGWNDQYYANGMLDDKFAQRIPVRHIIDNCDKIN